MSTASGFYDDDAGFDKSPTNSPTRKNPKGKHVTSRQKSIVVNMYKHIKLKTPAVKYKDMVAEISQISGIGRQTIIKTIAEYRKSGTVRSPNKNRTKPSIFNKLAILDRNGLRQKVHSIWLRRELPTIDRILVEVNKDPAIQNFKRTSLYNVIKKLDFIFIKRKGCSVLTEREDLIVCRRNYLHEIRKYRKEGRKIYYLDEMWLNVGDSIEQDQVGIDRTVLFEHDTGLTDTAEPKPPTGKKKRLIVLHIGSAKGFLKDGLLCFESRKNTSHLHDEINGDNFKDWFESIIPRLEPNSIVVMDNAPHHSAKTENIPTWNSKKVEIMEWLNSKDVTFDRPMLKPQLMVKVRELTPKFESYVIDNLAKNAGHTILRLPSYHGEFNPMNLAFEMVKEYVKQVNTTFKVDDVRQHLNTAIERVTTENWKTFFNRVIKEEKNIWKVDDVMDEIIDNMDPSVITFTDDTF